MLSKSVIASGLTAGTLVMASLGVFVPAALASPSPSSPSGTVNGTTHCDPSAPPTMDNPACGQNPVLVGPPPSTVDIPSSCPTFLSTDAWVLQFTGGNAVSHGTQNKNGDWGGGTATGPATLSSSAGIVQYSGHLTEWGGGGQNSNPGGPPLNQSENGFTLNFNGSGPLGAVSIHINMHTTTNNAGTPTANTFNVTVSC